STTILRTTLDWRTRSEKNSRRRATDPAPRSRRQTRLLDVLGQASRLIEALRRHGALGLGEQRLVRRVEDERFHREIETAQGRQLREASRHTGLLQQASRGAAAAVPLDRAQEVPGPVPGLTARGP